MDTTADLQRGSRCIVAAVGFATLTDLLAATTFGGAFHSIRIAAAIAVVIVITIGLANWLYSGSRPARSAFFTWLGLQVVVNLIITGYLVFQSLPGKSPALTGFLLGVLGVRFLVYGMCILVLAQSRDVHAFLASHSSH